MSVQSSSPDNAATNRIFQRSAGWMCGLLLLGAILAVVPYANMGINDDWSYIYSARVLADTGRVVYNGWAAFMLGWQLYAGALFIKLFGFSFTAVRASVFVEAVLTAPLMYALFVRFGIRAANAVAGTLTILLSPLYLPLATTYMSDVPGFLVILGCLYFCVRAVQAQSDRAAVQWLMLAAAENLVGGTVRQIVWLGVLVMVPSTAWFLRRRRGVLLSTAIAWIMSLITIVLLLRWFNHQPYVPLEKLVGLPTGLYWFNRQWRAVVQAGFTLLLLTMPVMTGFALRYPIHDGKRRRQLLIVLGCVTAAVAFLSLRKSAGVRWMGLLMGNYVTPKGVNLPLTLGEQPDLISRGAQAWVMLYLCAVTAVCLLMAWHARPLLRSMYRRAIEHPAFWLLMPFNAATFLLIITRLEPFDRYYLPLMFALLLLLLHLFERRYRSALPAGWVFPMIMLALWGIAVTHDLYSNTRARADTAAALVASGVAPGSIRAGMEWDGWTEIELHSYVNDPRIRFPAGAYRPYKLPAGFPQKCVEWMDLWTPSIRARYILSAQPDICYPRAPIPPVTYRTWLPPFQRTFYVLEIPQAIQDELATSWK